MLYAMVFYALFMPRLFVCYTELGGTCSYGAYLACQGNNSCRAFPLARRDCSSPLFCHYWTTSARLQQIATWGSGMAFLETLIVMVSGLERRKRAWKTIAWLNVIQAVFNLSSLIGWTFIYRHFVDFKQGLRYATGYFFLIAATGLNLLLVFTLLLAAHLSDLSPNKPLPPPPITPPIPPPSSSCCLTLAVEPSSSSSLYLRNSSDDVNYSTF